MERENLLFMAEAFNAKAITREPKLIQFSLGSFKDAEKFGKFLDLKGFDRSAIVGHIGAPKYYWVISVWMND